MKNKRILITGGSGFVGSHLMEKLIDLKNRVTNFDAVPSKFEKKSVFIKGNIVNRKQVEKAVKNHDLIFHLAGILGTHETVGQPVKTTMINIIGTLHILNAAYKNKIPVIYISKPNYWINPYTITKVAAEQYCLMYYREFGLNTKIIKWFNVYGPRQKTTGVQKAIPTFIVQALKNKPLTVFGNGRQTMDLIWVGDTIEATIRVAKSSQCTGKIIEVGSGREVSVNKITKTIINLTNSQSEIIHLPMRRGETENTKICADLSLLKKYTRYIPKTSLKKGLLKTIEYYKNFI